MNRMNLIRSLFLAFFSSLSKEIPFSSQLRGLIKESSGKEGFDNKIEVVSSSGLIKETRHEAQEQFLK